MCFCAIYKNTPLRVIATTANKIHKTFAVVTCASFNPTGQPTSKIAARNKYIQDIIIVRLFYYLNTALSNPLYNQGSYDNIDNNFIIIYIIRVLMII